MITVSALAASPAADAKTWTDHLGSSAGPTAQTVDGPLVSGGRVYWLQVRTAGGTDAVLRSRTVGGADAKRTTVQIPPPATALGDPSLASVGQVQLRISNDVAFVGATWCASPNDQSVCAPSPTASAFLLKTGASKQPVQGTPIFLRGSAPVFEATATRPAGKTIGLQAAFNRPTKIDIAQDDVDPQVAGDYVASVRGRGTTGAVFGGGSDHWSTVEVTNWRTGKRLYTISATRIAKVAAASGAGVQRPDLLPDGSLAPLVWRTGAGRGLTPVFVNSHGAVKRLGRSIAGAQAVQVARYATRAFIYVFNGKKTSAGKRRCDATWLTSATGSLRGHRLAGASRRGLPSFWNGSSAVWAYPTSSSAEDSRGIRGETSLKSMRLSASDTPRC